MTDTPTRDELLDELIAAIEPPKLGDEWFCIKDVAERTGRKYDSIRDWLDQATAAGTVEQCRHNGKLYFRVKHE